MLEAIEAFKVLKYLKRILRDYLKIRRLLYPTCEGQKEKTVTANSGQKNALFFQKSACSTEMVEIE